VSDGVDKLSYEVKKCKCIHPSVVPKLLFNYMIDIFKMGFCSYACEVDCG